MMFYSKLLERIRRKLPSKIVKIIAKILNVDLRGLSDRDLGIGVFGNMDKTGETYLVEKILPKYLESEKPIFFDVGANVGNFSQLLRNNYPNAKIFAFEPNNKAFVILNDISQEYSLRAENIGFGASIQGINLYSYKNIEGGTELGTCNSEALGELFDIKDDIEVNNIKIVTIDSYCEKNNINQIDFLKIDVEGYELEVLKGAEKMIEQNKIPLIQFEFNRFNVIYRVFLRDFYSLLKKYDLYRIKMNGLVPLGEYETSNEIFKYQNILAILKTLK